LHKYGQTIYGTRGGPMKPQSWGVTTQSLNNIYIHLMYPYETESLFIPIKTKPRSVKIFGSDAEVKYIMTKDGISINATGLNISGPDTIIWIQQ